MQWLYLLIHHRRIVRDLGQRHYDLATYSRQLEARCRLLERRNKVLEAQNRHVMACHIFIERYRERVE